MMAKKERALFFRLHAGGVGQKLNRKTTTTFYGSQVNHIFRHLPPSTRSTNELVDEPKCFA